MNTQSSLLNKKAENMKQKILRINEVCERLGVSDTTLWRWRRAKSFPEPKSIQGSSVKAIIAAAADRSSEENFGDKEESDK